MNVDPSGPAGKQYALPLDSVRGEAAGNPSLGIPGAKSPAPRFGEGISPLNEVGERAGPDVADRGQSGGGAAESNKAMDDEAGPVAAALISGSGGGSSTTLGMIVLISLIAVVGLTGGLVGRRTLQ